ncbi:phage/plasmid primase, P4 family [Enterocloster citroniae]|uniref:DNA primase family protein n=1 Tax=Enterocloster citroniae TaxID=358743 RepID=UPI001D07F83D|nr:phage/plasmid primase, P4 family [Enterocloster citroniae]MCB7062299.1 phage/plasmid primase, P4 family [Enterocloster citroniae]
MSKEAAQNPSADIAVWFDGKAINEVIFCEEFLRDYPMITVNGTFFTVNGIVNDENRLKKEIYDRIKPYVTSNIAKRITNLLDVMRMECCAADLLLYQDRIHVANGTYHLDGTFSTEKDYCRNRLPVAYHPEAPQPVTWLHFLSQLLEPEDILTLQEFIGYCFIPSTKGQKMLMLTGKGGEGKSRIGVVLRALLGTNMKTGSVAKVETSNFARADLEHELLMLDDDMKLEALPQTNNIKAIITAELPMDLERKRQQSYQGDLYVRFIGLGNGVLQALHDRSVGFFRRQIILTTKEKDPNRKDDPYIAEKMTAEAEGIFLWALEGLHRLIANDFRFTLSQSALDNLNDAVSDGNNIIDFLASEGYIRFRADYEASSKNLYAVYKQWCDDNALNSLSQKSFGSFLKQNESRYNLEYTNKVNIGGGRFARGFVGIELLQRPFL